MKLYIDNTTHTCNLGVDVLRQDPDLFTTKSAIFDAAWEIEGQSVNALCSEWIKNKSSKRFGYLAQRVQNNLRAVGNSFEFVGTHGLSQIFNINQSTACRSMKRVPHVKHDGQFYISSTYGLVAFCLLLLKNQMALRRNLNDTFLNMEKFFFLVFDEISTKASQNVAADKKCLQILLDNNQLPVRSADLLAIEQANIKKTRGWWPIKWVGAIPMFIGAPSYTRLQSTMVTKCGLYGLPIANYKVKQSNYIDFMNQPFVGLMYPRRRDRYDNLNMYHEIVGSWPDVSELYKYRDAIVERGCQSIVLRRRFSRQANCVRRGIRYGKYIMRA